MTEDQGQTSTREHTSVENLHAVSPRRRRPFALVAVCLAALGVGGAFYVLSARISEPSRAAAPPKRAPVPVSVETAVRRDLPVYVTGLGTVQGWFTVGIHSQVDGKLQEVLFSEGQRVKKGDILAKIDPRLFQAALDRAKARRAQDQAMLIAAEKDLARDKLLITRSAVTEQALDQQVAKVAQLKAAIAADDAAIETAQTQLDYSTITAPSDGRMGVRLVDPGNVVHASDNLAIATLVLTQPAAVMFTLPVRYLDDVRGAMARGELEVVAFDQDNERPLSTGKLLMIDNQIDQATASFRLKAVFPNTDERLWPGEFVNARLHIETRPSVVVVPSSAVQRGPEGLLTWTITKDNTAVTRRIEVGPTTGGLTIVTSGVSERARRHRRTIQIAIECPDQYHFLPIGRGFGGLTREHFRTVRPPSGRNLPGDGGSGLCRLERLSVPAGGPVASGRFSDRPGHRRACRGQRRDHGLDVVAIYTVCMPLP